MASWKPKHVAFMFFSLIIFYMINLSFTTNLFVLLIIFFRLFSLGGWDINQRYCDKDVGIGDWGQM